jgi:hypothetical protein
MSDQWDQLEDRIRAILDGYGGEGVVAVRPSLVRALRGNGNAAILASELLFWSRRLGDPQGWFFQQQRRLEQQTGLGPDAQRKAVRLLERLGVLETARRGVPARLFSCINLPRLAALLLQHGQAVSVADHDRQQDADHGLELELDNGLQLGAGDGRPQDAGDGPPQAVGHGQRHKENNKDIKEEIKEDIPLFPPQGVTTPPKKPGRRSTPKHPLPDDFTITAAMRAWAAEHAPQVDLEHETLKLVAWARAKGEWRSDWTATWRLWVLNAATPGPRGQRGAASPPERHAGIRTRLDQKLGHVGDSP